MGLHFFMISYICKEIACLLGVMREELMVRGFQGFGLIIWRIGM